MKHITLAILIITLLSLACGGSGSQNQPAAPAADQPAEAPASYTIGQDVQVGEAKWKILEVKYLGQELKSDNEFMEPKKTNGNFVLVRLQVENGKTEAATYAGISLVDDKGRKFERYSEQFGYIPDEEACVLEQLNPNLAKTCSEIFELPADAKGLKALVGDLEMFGGSEAQVDLGL